MVRIAAAKSKAKELAVGALTARMDKCLETINVSVELLQLPGNQNATKLHAKEVLRQATKLEGLVRLLSVRVAPVHPVSRLRPLLRSAKK